ncbi:MAG: hypothetical protein JXA58_03800 [Dehalococcoidia bacterium]|nr:hypothetical protein [Dehalococcoidia bacterium]
MVNGRIHLAKDLGRRDTRESPYTRHSIAERAKAYAREHGLLALARVAFRTYVFSRSLFYVYVCPHTVSTAGEPLPSVDNFAAVFVSSNDEADQLAETHEDFRLLDKRARRGLSNGAVALCLYSGSTLVNVSWLATNARAHRAIDSIGLPFDVAIHGAWTGRVRTKPAYEGRGLFRYACAKRFEHVVSRGIDKSCTSVADVSTRSHVMSASLGCHLAGKGHVVRLFWWHWWRSVRLTAADEAAVRQIVEAALANRDVQ